VHAEQRNSLGCGMRIQDARRRTIGSLARNYQLRLAHARLYDALFHAHSVRKRPRSSK
jgi:hypothetical protein